MVDPSVRRLQVRERLGAAGGPRGLRRLQPKGAGLLLRRRRHHVPSRPPRLLLLHQWRAGPLRGGPAPRRPRHGALCHARAGTCRRPRAGRGGGATAARPRRVRRRSSGAARVARRVVRHGRCCRRGRRRRCGGCPRQPRPHVSVISLLASHANSRPYSVGCLFRFRMCRVITL
jgi:hypothetical protein